MTETLDHSHACTMYTGDPYGACCNGTSPCTICGHNCTICSPPLRPTTPPTAWTPGQWYARWEQDDEGDLGFILVADADADDEGRTVDASYPILEDGLLTDDDSDVNKANLQVMAAGPDLYEALVRVKALLAQLGLWEEMRRRKPGALWDACHRAELAMAKARGDDAAEYALVMVGVDEDEETAF